jgi:polyisoprenoid-binding protein YceI
LAISCEFSSCAITEEVPPSASGADDIAQRLTDSVSGDLTIRGITRSVSLRVRYLGQWQTPWWEDGVDKGPKTRAGFTATTTIDRHDFGVSWNAPLDRGGLVVGNIVEITIDAEAILEEV